MRACVRACVCVCVRACMHLKLRCQNLYINAEADEEEEKKKKKRGGGGWGEGAEGGADCVFRRVKSRPRY